jgi:hypothetical protein
LRQRLYLACLFLHLLLITAVSCRETLSLIARGLTVIPSTFKSWAQRGEAVAVAVLGQNLAASNPMRRMITAYLHLAGIERGYGYFAPNVPASYKLVFELHYPDGRVEYRLPRVNSTAAGLRVAGLLDEIGRTRYDALREHLVKMLAASTWREHPDVMTMRAIFGAIIFPSVSEFERGKRESYQFLYAYDFSRRE